MRLADKTWLCDFCRSTQHEVDKIFSAPDKKTCICNECVTLAFKVCLKTNKPTKEF